MTMWIGRIGSSALVALALGAFSQQPAPQQKSTTVVLGRVVEGLSDAGVADALVSIRGLAEPYFTASALTSSHGDFVFANLAAGTYSFVASRSGYVFGEFGQRRIGGRGRGLVVAADKHIADVRVPVWKAGAVSGVVLDDIGEPVTGITVQALTTSNFGGQIRMSTPYKTTQTDDRGMFRLSGLIPGPSALSVSAVELAALAPRGSPAHPVGEPAYAPAYFPPGVLAGSASTLMLSAGEERRGISFRLQLAQTRRVSGHVSGAGDRGGILVRLVRASDRFTEDPVLAESVTTSDGVFTFDRVIPGEYVARVFEVAVAQTSGAHSAGEAAAPWSAPAPRTAGITGSATVVVADANVDNVDITLQSTLRISGQVVFNGTAPKPRLDALALYLQPWLASGRTVPRTRSTVDADFRFKSGELGPGHYFIRWAAANLPEWAIESITRDGSDALDRPIPVGTSDVDGIVVTLTDRISEVSGVVRTVDNSADVDAAVIVFPVNPALWSEYGLDSPRLRYVRANANGIYTVRSLPAGEYLAVALDDAFTESWNTRAFLERWSRTAVKFSVAIGAKQTLDLRTVPAR